jgi:hypothetical protein
MLHAVWLPLHYGALHSAPEEAVFRAVKLPSRATLHVPQQLRQHPLHWLPALVWFSMGLHQWLPRKAGLLPHDCGPIWDAIPAVSG